MTSISEWSTRAFRNIVEDGNTFDKCQRRNVAYERQFTRALNKFQKLQASRSRQVPHFLWQNRYSE